MFTIISYSWMYVKITVAHKFDLDYMPVVSGSGDDSAK